MRTLLRCPYGHESEVNLVNVKEPLRFSSEHAIGYQCRACKRVFVSEYHFERIHMDPWGPPEGTIKLQFPIYEVDGPWSGNSLTFMEVQE